MAWSLLDSGTTTLSAAGSGQTYNFPAGTVSANDLLTLSISSDTIVSTPSTWSLAVSDVHQIGAYIFYKVAAGTESSVTVTTSGSNPTAAGFLRYSGNATSSPLDQTASGFNTTSTSNTPTGTTSALAQSNELAIAAGCLGGLEAASQSGITWSSGFTGRLNGTTAGTGTTDQRILVADNTSAGTAAVSASVSWTNSTNNQTILVATFLPAAGAPGGVTCNVMVVPAYAPVRAAVW